MFGKKGSGFSAKTPMHSVMTRHLWPSNTMTGYRDHMIKIHQTRLTEKLPKPAPPKKPRPSR
jgi:hypothetical protein